MEMTREEKKFRNLMVVYFFLFLGSGIYFYMSPEKLHANIVTLGTWLGFAQFDPVSDKFWVILTISLMMTIAASCFMASIKVRETKHYVIPVFISKLTSSGLGLREFIAGEPHGFHYLVIALVDFPLFVLAFLYYIRAVRSVGSVRGGPPPEKEALQETALPEN